jgi:hypothetical protein
VNRKILFLIVAIVAAFVTLWIASLASAAVINCSGGFGCVGTSGDDQFNGTSGFDFMDGLGGNDTFHSSAGGDTGMGRQGVDYYNAGPGRNTFDGGDGNDRFFAPFTCEPQTFYGRAGNADEGSYVKGSGTVFYGVEIKHIIGTC